MGSVAFLSTPGALLAEVVCIGFLCLIQVFLIVQLFRKTRQLDERQKMFLKGKHGADLESVIVRHDQEIGNLDTEIQELFALAEQIRELAMIGIHKVGIVRFNPFQDTGSNQSWSIALLDGDTTGLVISSLLSRESARVYAKPVVQGQAKDFPFTAEEKRAIELAQTSRDPKKAPATPTQIPTKK
ncbi:MAG: DUF4446 family protein [Candidatus Moraniibacteriota bacterium]|nr:MAG: DUF4446 family protein [Candidatus Moranbacteria bacterium]